MALRAVAGGRLVLRSLQQQPTGRRHFSPFGPIVNLPYQVPAQQAIYASKAPTYLKNKGDGLVVALGLGGLTLALLRLFIGYYDMSHGTNKIEVE